MTRSEVKARAEAPSTNVKSAVPATTDYVMKGTDLALNGTKAALQTSLRQRRVKPIAATVLPNSAKALGPEMGPAVVVMTDVYFRTADFLVVQSSSEEPLSGPAD